MVRKSLKFVVASLVVGFFAGIMGTATAQKSTVPHPARPPDKFTLGLDSVKRLLLLMDADRRGKISKQAFMRFMEAEFDRLDKNRNGELDLPQLARTQLVASQPRFAGK